MIEPDFKKLKQNPANTPFRKIYQLIPLLALVNSIETLPLTNTKISFLMTIYFHFGIISANVIRTYWIITV
jgi:hypothetical protein